MERADARAGNTERSAYIATPPETRVMLSLPKRLTTRQVMSHQPAAGISCGCSTLRPRSEVEAADSQGRSGCAAPPNSGCREPGGVAFGPLCSTSCDCGGLVVIFAPLVQVASRAVLNRQ